MLNVGLKAFKGGFFAWMHKRNEKAIARYKAYGRNIFNDIVMRTPEYTGGTAASWKFGVGALSTEGPNYLPKPDLPYVAARTGYGNETALAIAFAEVADGMEKIKSLSQAIFISNPAEFDRGNAPPSASSKYVAKAIEDSGNTWLRVENRPGDAVREAVSYAKSFNWYRGGGLMHEF